MIKCKLSRRDQKFMSFLLKCVWRYTSNWCFHLAQPPSPDDCAQCLEIRPLHNVQLSCDIKSGSDVKTAYGWKTDPGSAWLQLSKPSNQTEARKTQKLPRSAVSGVHLVPKCPRSKSELSVDVRNRFIWTETSFIKCLLMILCSSVTSPWDEFNSLLSFCD